MKRKINTNARILSDLFTDYNNTFIAFCELINNSIQAASKNIYISIEQIAPEELYPIPIRKIIIMDDGIGVAESEFDKKILQIGTDVKVGGRGVGRFAALQIGSTMEIETIAYDSKKKAFTKVMLPITSFYKQTKDLAEFEFETKEEVYKDKINSYYKVTITDLYDTSVTEKDKKKKMDRNLFVENISDALFKRYPSQIFSEQVNFYINEEKIDRNKYVINEPVFFDTEFEDKKGDKHKIEFSFYNLKSDRSDIKIFLTVDNAGLHTISGTFDYSAEWLSPKIGSWFIYIYSDLFTINFNRNIDLEDMDENQKAFRDFLKGTLYEFFKEKNKDYEQFTERLKSDPYYPYQQQQPSSNSQHSIFEKVSYLVEDKYHLLSKTDPTREIIYPLIDKTITSGNMHTILNNVLKLDDDLLGKLNDLLEKSDLESVIKFSEEVVNKTHFLDFLNLIIYGEPAKRVKERSQLHKFVEKNLWIFGEQYASTPNLKLLSDKNLSNNLDRLREDNFNYEPSAKDGNVIELDDVISKNITDLFFYNEKINDDETREIMVVELKAPKVKIHQKELNQIDKYQFQIESEGSFSANLKYKLILIGNDISQFAKSKIGVIDRSKPFLYSQSKVKNIESWVIYWSDLIEYNRRKLSYLGNGLKIKDKDVIEEFEREFEEIKFDNIKSKRSTLRKVVSR